MKSKIKSKNEKIPSPYNQTAHKTERTAVAVIMHWMREIIDKKNIDLGMPDVETIGADKKMPDIVIYESRRSQKVLCLFEAKQPFFDVFSEKNLKEPAREKATKRKAKYFALTNFKSLLWYNTEKVNALKPEEEQLIGRYTLSEIENLNDIEQTRFSASSKRAIEDFLTKLYKVHSGKEPEPKHAVDDFLILRLQEKIRVLSNYYKDIIYNQCHKDTVFRKKLTNWFIEQNWSFTWSSKEFDIASRQTAYLLVNKILFYNVIQSKRPQELDPLDIPESRTKGALLKTDLQCCFEYVLKKIDYETIYTTDFIDILAFPDVEEVVEEIKELTNIFKRYDFSKLGFDIIGRIFERLIPPDERHNLGQYFTNPDIVDLILKFCLHHEDEKILDPACGAGTFLVRAYQHKKIMNMRKSHEEILKTIWGNDIAKFPAQLATINIAINDLSVDENYPNIIDEDFFELHVGDDGFDPDKWRKRRAKTLNKKEIEIVYPRYFDAIVGNPPYTRQEEISKISPEYAEYKENLIKKALCYNDKKVADISKRAGIHSYFFVHGTKFLKDDGYFGFIVSNSWLDVDYGKGLQEFFLKNYKIITIIESKVERWFEEADINTCIIILQKCGGDSRIARKEREENLVRFVYFKKSLRNFIPPAEDIWEKQVERLNEIDKLKKTILAHNDFYENEDLRIFPKSQKELWDEGYDSEEKKYIGAKWGKYLRAPEIFFKILKKGKGKLVPLKEIADVRRGFTTGANEFFYLTEEDIKRKKIEKEFWMHKDKKGNWIPNYVIKSPRECKTIIIDPNELKFRVLMIHKDKEKLEGKKILKYIEEGERKEFDKRPTCMVRKKWYELPEINAPIISKRFVDVSFTYFFNTEYNYIGDTFFVVIPKRNIDIIKIVSYLNSSIGSFFTEVYGRTVMGEGVLLIYGPEIVPIPILDPRIIPDGRKKIIKKFISRKVKSIFEELGAYSPEEVSLDKVKPDRRELDKIIMGEILGLTDEEQLEVYQAVVDLVKSRIEKAKSFNKNKKIKNGIDINTLKNLVVDKINNEEEQ